MTIKLPSRRTVLTLLAVAGLSLVLALVFGAFRIVRTDGGNREQAVESVSLPTPSGESDVSVEEAIANRRSRREYDENALSRRELGQLLWAAQGVTERTTGYRAAPSAGALYPLEVYVVVGTPGVDDLGSGVYHYRPENHELARRKTGTVQSELRAAAVDQEFVEEAAIDIVVCAVDERTTGKYGERGRKRYVPMEAGHAGENLYLQAEALGLATVSIGAFSDDRVRDVVEAPSDQRPLYVFPVGGRQ
ncbi:SagB/ThcOx family dehydrogenase [Halopenitus sp. H-Gu1]|uniref:SagB/ThcOx family dehydrogenase n=1 Tax=Halopenitus sp. H-Gu1 TaxID=3242697 RepID=UPI00359CBF20